MRAILIIGGGELAQQLAHYIQSCDAQAMVAGFVDDFANKGEERFGAVCLGPIASIPELYVQQKFDAVIIGIGYNHRMVRQQLFETLHCKVPFYTFVHPTAFIDASAAIGDGCFFGPHAIVEQRTVVGANVFLYGGVNLSHDSKIGSHTFLAPSVTIAGFSQVGSRCFIGIHTTVIERVNIADDVVVGAGALVLHHLPEPGIYIGVPAYKKEK